MMNNNNNNKNIYAHAQHFSVYGSDVDFKMCGAAPFYLHVFRLCFIPMHGNCQQKPLFNGHATTASIYAMHMFHFSLITFQLFSSASSDFCWLCAVFNGLFVSLSLPPVVACVLII